MKFHEDDRAQRLLDVFPSMEGQINISYVDPGHVVAWHMHKIQTDIFVCLQGRFKVGLYNPGLTPKFLYLSDRNHSSLEIPPGTYHGYMALEPNSIMLYHLTHKYNPEDEYRATPGDFGETWEVESK